MTGLDKGGTDAGGKLGNGGVGNGGVGNGGVGNGGVGRIGVGAGVGAAVGGAVGCGVGRGVRRAVGRGVGRGVACGVTSGTAVAVGDSNGEGLGLAIGATASLLIGGSVVVSVDGVAGGSVVPADPRLGSPVSLSTPLWSSGMKALATTTTRKVARTASAVSRHRLKRRTRPWSSMSHWLGRSATSGAVASATGATDGRGALVSRGGRRTAPRSSLVVGTAAVASDELAGGTARLGLGVWPGAAAPARRAAAAGHDADTNADSARCGAGSGAAGAGLAGAGWAGLTGRSGSTAGDGLTRGAGVAAPPRRVVTAGHDSRSGEKAGTSTLGGSAAGGSGSSTGGVGAGAGTTRSAGGTERRVVTTGPDVRSRGGSVLGGSVFGGAGFDLGAWAGGVGVVPGRGSDVISR